MVYCKNPRCGSTLTHHKQFFNCWTCTLTVIVQYFAALQHLTLQTTLASYQIRIQVSCCLRLDWLCTSSRLIWYSDCKHDNLTSWLALERKSGCIDDVSMRWVRAEEKGTWGRNHAWNSCRGSWRRNTTRSCNFSSHKETVCLTEAKIWQIWVRQDPKKLSHAVTL